VFEILSGSFCRRLSAFIEQFFLRW